MEAIMALNWIKKDYFAAVIHADERSACALELLVDDLHIDREKTVSYFLCHNGSEDFLWALMKLLSYSDVRIAGNAAYIIGMLAESELGCYRILNLMKKNSALQNLLDMLVAGDGESVMNSAGTIGTLAETNDGRDWMIESSCINSLLSRMSSLLEDENMWTASNAALVLARLTISILGSTRVLEHDESQLILTKLINALGLDEAGRGMNAAFAIGRLCDLDVGRNRLLAMPDSEKMISALSRMLSCVDTGASKNACFALSCLASTPEGHSRLLRNVRLDDVLKTLTSLVVSQDAETSWFAAMTIRTVASQPAGCLRLREATHVTDILKSLLTCGDISPDLREEIQTTLDILKRLGKPNPPRVTVWTGETVEVTWDEVKTKCGFQVKYQLFEGARLVYTGAEVTTMVGRLQPCTLYVFRLRAGTEGDDSPLSDAVTVTTEEAPPSAPTQLRVIGATTTQLKLLWEPPERPNGHLRGYYVYTEKKLFEHTQELSCIVTGLSPSSTYQLSVCAATSKGKGERTCVTGTTSDLGAHAPAKPNVTVMGRSEVFVTWEAPENPLGKINRYDLTMNGHVVYSGTELCYTVHRLQPDTDYSFTVCALTNEGRCESKITKKRTSKDEYDDASRAPLYQSPANHSRRDSDAASSVKPAANVRRAVNGKRRKSSITIPSNKARATSAKVKSDVQDSENKMPSGVQNVKRRASLQLTHKTSIDRILPKSKAPITRAIATSSAPKAESCQPVVSHPAPTEPSSQSTPPPEPQEPIKTVPDDERPPALVMTRSYTTLNITAPVGPQKPNHYADTLEVLSRTTRPHSIPVEFLRRANTFAGMHRPGIQRHMNRHLGTPSPTSPSDQFAGLQRHRSAQSGTKFVPVQMRAQPTNLPHGRRRVGNVKVNEAAQVEFHQLDSAVARHQTIYPTDHIHLSVESEIERLAVAARKVPNHRANVPTEEICNKTFTRYTSRVHDPRPITDSRRKLQSAR